MRAALVFLLIGLAVAVIIFVATSGRVIFLPLIFLPLVFFWPRRRSRDRRF
jgi:Flp pilus assembly protein TadB